MQINGTTVAIENNNSDITRQNTESTSEHSSTSICDYFIKADPVLTIISTRILKLFTSTAAVKTMKVSSYCHCMRCILHFNIYHNNITWLSC